MTNSRTPRRTGSSGRRPDSGPKSSGAPSVVRTERANSSEESRSEWFRVDLLDGYVTCFVSQDGQEWTAIDQRRIEQTTPIHVGLVVCSVVSGQPCEATFEDVTVVELERTVE
ncbi:DUF1349 domain-containing protein [Natrialba swarupiae]|nr:DUF1349 domain-containing protein [Natrialba swarupiae]